MRLPINHATRAVTLRHGFAHEPESFRTREFTGVDPDRHERYARQHRPGAGWPRVGVSAYHPNVLDYRTVDELGLPVETLDEMLGLQGDSD